MIDLDALILDDFAGLAVVVLGLARTGVALCRFLVDHGAVVTAYDARPPTELAEHLALLGGRQVTLCLGPNADPLVALQGQRLICTSPAISSHFPTTELRLRAALAEIEAAGSPPVVSEIDLFLRLAPALTVGVTGTKGKTTTATLAAAVLERGGAPVLLGGNTGTPLIDRLAELTPSHRVVLELSELQLPTLSRGTTISVFTNVTVDHLDRHGTVEAYQAVKRRLASLTPADGHVVLNADDPVSASFAGAARATVVRYSRDPAANTDIAFRDGWIESRARRVMPVSEIQLRGAHNVSNVMAAIAVGTLLDVETAAMRDAVRAFAGLENRLESVATVAGVHFINDTQATQPDAVIAALRSFEPPIVLIAGGADKCLPFDKLSTEVAARAYAVVLIGETAPAMERLFRDAGAPHVERADDVGEAVHRANDLAHRALSEIRAQQATVLLSPAAAGIDLLTGYSVRGDLFKRAVAEIAGVRSKALPAT